MRNEHQRQRFALESPNAQCFSAIAASGRINGCTPWCAAGVGTVRALDEQLTVEMARSMWSARKRGSAHVASLVAGFCSDGDLLVEMLHFDKRTSVICAAVTNPACPLSELFEQALKWAASPYAQTFQVVKQCIEKRFATMPIDVALGSLRDGLHAELFVQVADRDDLTFELADEFLASSWKLLSPTRFERSTLWFVEALAQSEHVAARWPTDVLAGFFDVAGADTADMAVALAGANPSLIGDDVVGVLLVAAAAPPVAPTTGSESVQPQSYSPEDRLYRMRRQRATGLARTLAEDPGLSGCLLEVLVGWYGGHRQQLAAMFVDHPNADPLWWATAPLESLVGSAAAAKLLARDVRFHDPGLWLAADVLGDSWLGTVEDFVVAAQALLG